MLAEIILVACVAIACVITWHIMFRETKWLYTAYAAAIVAIYAAYRLS